jgi:equilibrative nucleoside transporter 1/2/3
VIVSCIGIAFALKKLAYFQYYANPSGAQREDDVTVVTNDNDDTHDLTQEFNDLTTLLPQASPKNSLLGTLNRIKLLAISVFLVYATTLSLFPAILRLIESTHAKDKDAARFQQDIFVPFAFLIFSLMDWLGKSLPGFPALPLPAVIFGRHPDGTLKRLNYASIKSPMALLLLAVARFAFFPLLLTSNWVIRNVKQEALERPSTFPLLIQSDALYIILVALFAFTNGWFGSLNMIHAPGLVKSMQEKERIGKVMVLCLSSGLVIGSLFSFAVRSGICGGCNPFIS